MADKADAGLPVISKQELRQHGAASARPWVALHGGVYDVTTFVNEHPGGVSVLKELAGTDITAAFTDQLHSNFARTMLKRAPRADVNDAAPSAPKAAEGTTATCNGQSLRKLGLLEGHKTTQIPDVSFGGAGEQKAKQQGGGNNTILLLAVAAVAVAVLYWLANGGF